MRRAAEDKDIDVVSAVESPANPNIGRDVGEVLGIGPLGIDVVGADGLASELQKKNPALLIDFTNPEACLNNVRVATSNGVGVVVGTTGFTPKQLADLRALITQGRVAGTIAPNFSVAVNLFFKMAGDLSAVLRDYDVEIIEAHHRFKRDAPSGTAKKLAQIIAESRDVGLKDVAVYGRHGAGERRREEIGIHSIRGGDIVGDHTVLFATIGERLEIRHQAHSRDAFAYGCLRAVKWLAKQEPGLYDMFDVLGLRR